MKTILLTLTLVLISGSLLQTPVFAVGAYDLLLDREEYVLGPVAGEADYPFFSTPVPGGIRGYQSNGTTYSYFGTSLNNMQKEGIALSAGTSGNFDECGAWLASVYKLTETHWVGWYHAEDDCDYANGITHKSIAFAESFDAGKTWTKTNYPNNRTITADSAFSGNSGQDDAGDFKVIKIGAYFYALFLASSDWQMHVARAAVTSQGKPGNWYKYYCIPGGSCGYTQPGLGGKSTPTNLPGIATHIIYSDKLQAYVAPFVTGRWGFGIAVSNGTNITSWSTLRYIYPAVSHASDAEVDNWSRTNPIGLKSLYTYASFVAPNGNSNRATDSMYLYYVKIFENEGFDQRYMFRRKLSFNFNNINRKANFLQLATYQNPQGKKKVSSSMAKPNEGYVYLNSLGYVSPNKKTGFPLLTECRIPAFNSYFLNSLNPASYGWEYCSSQNEPFLAQQGWISNVKSSLYPRPTYRCFNTATQSHFFSTDVNCEGQQKDFLYGYMATRNSIISSGQ